MMNRSLLTLRIMPAGEGVRFDPDQVGVTWKV